MKIEEIAKELKEELNKDRTKSPHTWNEISMQIRIVKQEWTRQKIETEKEINILEKLEKLTDNARLEDKYNKEYYKNIKNAIRSLIHILLPKLKDINNALKVLE